MRLINRNFTRLFYAQAISFIGDYVFDTTLVLWISTVLVTSGSLAPAAVSGVIFAVGVGVLLVGPVAGVFVDRWDHQRTMIAADLIRAVLIGLLAALALVPAGTVPTGVMLTLIYMIVLSATGTAQFFNTARFAFISRLVDETDRARASGVLQATGYTAAIVGPPLAAPLLFSIGPFWALAINAGSFLFSLALLRSIKVPPSAVPERASEPAAPSQSPVRRFFTELSEGTRFVGRNATLRTLLISLAVLTIGAATLNSLNVFFITENLHAAAGWFGAIGMGEGIGAVVGALTAGWLCRQSRDTTVYALGLALVGLGLVVYARLDTLWLAVTIAALIGIPIGAINAALSPILLRATPAEYLGRTIATLGPTQQVAAMVSALGSGWLASTALQDFHHSVGGVTFGRIDTIYLAAGLAIIVAGLAAAVTLRRSAPSTETITAKIAEGEPASDGGTGTA